MIRYWFRLAVGGPEFWERWRVATGHQHITGGNGPSVDLWQFEQHSRANVATWSNPPVKLGIVGLTETCQFGGEDTQIGVFRQFVSTVLVKIGDSM